MTAADDKNAASGGTGTPPLLLFVLLLLLLLLQLFFPPKRHTVGALNPHPAGTTKARKHREQLASLAGTGIQFLVAHEGLSSAVEITTWVI
jgi:hypothetical protein